MGTSDVLKILKISHVLNEHGTRNEYLKPVESKNLKAHHRKEHLNISTFTKFEFYWLKRRHTFEIYNLREHFKFSCLSDF